MRFTVSIVVLLGLLLAVTLSSAGDTQGGADIDYLVNSAADAGNGVCNDGSCTLRDAILEANTADGGETIGFNIPGCPPTCTIQLSSALPAIAKPFKTFDGTTQPGAGAQNGVVVIDGSLLGAGNGLTVDASETILLGLTIRDFPGDGVKANSTTLDELELYDMRLLDNGGNGLSVAASNQVTIEDSAITGNTGHGVNTSFSTMGTLTLADSTISGNGQSGVSTAASSNLIVSGNTVQGNGAHGIDARFTTTSMVTIDSNDVIDNGDVGIATSANFNLTVTNNEVSSNQGHGIDASFNTTPTVAFEDNVITENDGSGVETAASDTLTIAGNEISKNGIHGLDASFFTPTTGTIAENTFVDNAMFGVKVSGPMDVHYNRFIGHAEAVSNSGATVHAQNNFWGCNEGPNTLAGCDTVDGNVDFDPWLVLNADASPDTIAVGESSTLTADVTMNSDAVDTSAGGHIQDETLITFATDDAGLASAAAVIEKPTTSGIASATLEATAGPMVASVLVSLDSATVDLQITITEPPETPTPTPSPTPAPTASPGPTATATPPPGADLVQGDNDCDGDVDAVDGLKGLQHIAAIPFGQEPDCPAIGSGLLAAAPAGDPPEVFGDVDCDGDVDAVDQLKILQFVAAIPFTQDEPCVDVGEGF